MIPSIKYGTFATLIITISIQSMEPSFKKIGAGVTAVATAVGIIYASKRYQTNREENKKLKRSEYYFHSAPELKGWFKAPPIIF